MLRMDCLAIRHRALQAHRFSSLYVAHRDFASALSVQCESSHQPSYFNPRRDGICAVAPQHPVVEQQLFYLEFKSGYAILEGHDAYSTQLHDGSCG